MPRDLTAASSTARNAPCPCGSGRKYKACHFAADRAVADARDAGRRAHEVVDGALARVLPLVESQAGEKVKCARGCKACCTHFVRTSFAEALRIAEWLLAPENAAALARFEAALPSWRASVGDEVDAAEAVLRAGAVGADAVRAYAAACETMQRRRAMCVFNDDDGLCAIYALRPVPCRGWVSLSDPRRCDVDSPEAPAIVRHPAVDGAIAEVRAQLGRAVARVERHPPDRMLPLAVADALAFLRGRRAQSA